MVLDMVKCIIHFDTGLITCCLASRWDKEALLLSLAFFPWRWSFPFFFPSRDAPGVYQLASLLEELDASDEASQILCADALYQMGRVEEAHKLLLLALSGNPQRSPILARLALLQLKKGFLYDGNQVRSTWLAERMRELPVIVWWRGLTTLLADTEDAW